jgi:hypothetical protein
VISDFSLWITNIAAGIAKLPELLKRSQYQEWTSLAHPTARPCPSQYGLPGSSGSPLTSAAGGRNAVIRAAAYRLVMRNTSRGPRCVHRSVHGWGNDSNRLGRSGMRLVGGRHSLSGGENANAATGQNIGHVAVNCVKWANCDRPIAVLIRPDAILANMDDTTDSRSTNRHVAEREKRR